MIGINSRFNFLLFRILVLNWVICGPAARSNYADDGPDKRELESVNRASVEVVNALLKTIEATTVAAEVPGKIEELHVVEGSRVKMSQIIGGIHSDAVRLSHEKARLALAIARKKATSDINLRLAEKKSDVADNEYERALESNQRLPSTYSIKEIERLKLVAESTKLEIERAQEDQRLAELDVMLAENELKQAAEMLSLYQIESLVNGIVVSVERRVGEWVEPGTEIVKIVNNDRLRIEGFVSTEAASEELVGRRASVKVTSGESEWQVDGTVIFVSPEANPVNGNVRVFLEIDNRAGKFRPGMRVKASIKTAEP